MFTRKGAEDRHASEECHFFTSPRPWNCTLNVHNRIPILWSNQRYSWPLAAAVRDSLFNLWPSSKFCSSP
jgi:hypothetical protein